MKDIVPVPVDDGVGLRQVDETAARTPSGILARTAPPSPKMALHLRRITAMRGPTDEARVDITRWPDCAHPLPVGAAPLPRVQTATDRLDSHLRGGAAPD